jgi:ActR/RegA family two-component response regulator
MKHSQAPLEGIVVRVIDADGSARQLDRALSQVSAATFVAHDDETCRDLMKRIAPHFAVVDPSVSGGGPQSMA